MDIGLKLSEPSGDRTVYGGGARPTLPRVWVQVLRSAQVNWLTFGTVVHKCSYEVKKLTGCYKSPK